MYMKISIAAFLLAVASSSVLSEVLSEPDAVKSCFSTILKVTDPTSCNGSGAENLIPDVDEIRLFYSYPPTTADCSFPFTDLYIELRMGGNVQYQDWVKMDGVVLSMRGVDFNAWLPKTAAPPVSPANRSPQFFCAGGAAFAFGNASEQEMKIPILGNHYQVIKSAGGGADLKLNKWIDGKKSVTEFSCPGSNLEITTVPNESCTIEELICDATDEPTMPPVTDEPTMAPVVITNYPTEAPPSSSKSSKSRNSQRLLV